MADENVEILRNAPENRRRMRALELMTHVHDDTGAALYPPHWGPRETDQAPQE